MGVELADNLVFESADLLAEKKDDNLDDDLVV